MAFVVVGVITVGDRGQAGQVERGGRGDEAEAKNECPFDGDPHLRFPHLTTNSIQDQKSQLGNCYDNEFAVFTILPLSVTDSKEEVERNFLIFSLQCCQLLPDLSKFYTFGKKCSYK